jgi:hypothetical protein
MQYCFILASIIVDSKFSHITVDSEISIGINQYSLV